nr:hypothetical protein [Tanacetum cinerariifolium]
TVEDKILVPKPPKNCARCTRCGYLVDGPNCQGCALLRQELEENLVTYSPDFQNTSEPSNASTSVLNAPREPYGIPDNMCDVAFHDNSMPLDISKDQFVDFFDSNDDSTLIDDDSFSIDNIDYVEASPPHSELVNLGEMKDFHPKDGEIEDDILRERLSKINLLMVKIEALNANPTPSSDFVLKFPIPIEDSDSFFEKFDTSLSYSDNSLPEFETLAIIRKRRVGELTSVVMEDNLGEHRVHVPNVLPTHPTLMLDSDFIPSDDSLGSDLE